MHVYTEGFFQRVLYPTHAWLYLFLRGPSWAICFNCLPIKHKTSSKPTKDIFSPSLLCFLAGPKQLWMSAGDTSTLVVFVCNLTLYLCLCTISVQIWSWKGRVSPSPLPEQGWSPRQSSQLKGRPHININSLNRPQTTTWNIQLEVQDLCFPLPCTKLEPKSFWKTAALRSGSKYYT